MLEFKIDIDRKSHDDFIKTSKYCNLLQSSAWGDIKNNWDHTRLGVLENGELVASALVLIKHLPLGFTMMYIPRGPVMDFDNEEIMDFFFKELKKWAKKKRCLYVKFDPSVVLRRFTMQEQDKEYDQNALKIVENLKKRGMIFKGFTKNLRDTIQPRFHMGIDYTDNIEKHVKKSTVKSMKVAVRKHCEVKRVSKDNLDEFARIMHLTEERKNVHLRKKEYYENLMNAYGDEAYLFLTTVNPSVREKELLDIIHTNEEKLKDEELVKKSPHKIQEALNAAQKELDSMQDILAISRDEIAIAGALMIGFGDTVEMLYAGMDGRFYSFRPQYLTYLKRFEFAFEHGYKFVNMGGVEGTLDDGLSTFKSNFNPMVIEYIGEFDYPVNKMLYGISQYAFKLRKKIGLLIK